MHPYAIVRVLFLCYDLNMENVICNFIEKVNIKNVFIDSYDNEGFVPESINNCFNVSRETKSEEN